MKNKSSRPTLSVVLPTYNEKKNILILIPRIETVLSEFEYEILVVDDSSPDGTADAARELNKKFRNIKVIVRKKKQGIGAALRHGYREAGNDIIMSMDSDLSFEENDLLRLINKIEEGYDMVVGSRHSVSGNYEMKKSGIMVKGLVSRFGNKLNALLTGVKINDFSANFRAVRRDVWKKIKTRDNTNSILMEMIVKAKYKGFKVTQIPVKFKDRQYGESKLNLAKEAPKFFLKTVLYSLKYRFLR